MDTCPPCRIILEYKFTTCRLSHGPSATDVVLSPFIHRTAQPTPLVYYAFIRARRHLLGLWSAHPHPTTCSPAESQTENCPPSTHASGYNIVDNIRVLANQFGAVNIFKAYLKLPDKSSPRQSSLRSEFQSCGLSLTGAPTRPVYLISLTSLPRLPQQWKELGGLDDDRRVVPTVLETSLQSSHISQWISWRSLRTIQPQPQSSSSPAIVILPTFCPQSGGESTTSYSSVTLS